MPVKRSLDQRIKEMQAKADKIKKRDELKKQIAANREALKKLK